MGASQAPSPALEPAITEAGIRRLVHLFYGRVRRDGVLGPVFARALGESEEAWAAHLARLCDFWSAVMLTSGRYHGDPFSAHLRLSGIEPAMFARWLALFHASCAEVFAADPAAALGERAERIARSLRMGLFERLPARAGGVRHRVAVSTPRAGT